MSNIVKTDKKFLAALDNDVELAEYTIDKIQKFEETVKVDVKSKIKKKGNFNYLSWVYAVEFLKVNYPNSIFNKVEHFKDETGWWVKTYVQLEKDGDKHYEIYPVFEHRAKTDEQAGGLYSKEDATSMDINKAYQRCLVKNIATATGIGLRIYAGEDLPDTDIAISKEDAIWFLENKIPSMVELMKNGKYNTDNFLGLINKLWLGEINVDIFKGNK